MAGTIRITKIVVLISSSLLAWTVIITTSSDTCPESPRPTSIVVSNFILGNFSLLILKIYNIGGRLTNPYGDKGKSTKARHIVFSLTVVGPNTALNTPS